MAVIADAEISTVMLASRRITGLLAKGSWRRALNVSKSSIAQAGSTPFRHRRTSGCS